MTNGARLLTPAVNGTEATWRGILLMMAAVTLAPINQAVAKYLAAELPVMEIVWGRFVFHSAIVLPFILYRHGVHGLRPPNPRAQLIRGGLMCCATFFIFAAVARMPMADAIALVFIAPLVVTALSPALLKERVGVRRWAAVVIGFIGALIVIRPGAGVVEWGAFFALGSGVTYALYMIATRRMSGAAPPAVTLVYTALVGAVATSMLLPFFWVTPTLSALGFMMVTGMSSALGHLCLIRAYHYAEASLIAPIGYWEIVMATTLGFLFFGDFPALATWFGIAVIALSGIYVSMRGREGRP